MQLLWQAKKNQTAKSREQEIQPPPQKAEGKQMPSQSQADRIESLPPPIKEDNQAIVQPIRRRVYGVSQVLPNIASAEYNSAAEPIEQSSKSRVQLFSSQVKEEVDDGDGCEQRRPASPLWFQHFLQPDAILQESKIRLTIRRDAQGLNWLVPQYKLYLPQFQPALFARKNVGLQSQFQISQAGDKSQVRAKLKSNFSGTVYLFQDLESRDTGYIQYEEDYFGKNFRRAKAQFYVRGRQVLLVSQEPKWHQQKKGFVLQLGRGTWPSKKNLILLSQDRRVLSLRKVGSSLFQLEAHHPLTLRFAFAVALSSLDHKLCFN